MAQIASAKPRRLRKFLKLVIWVIAGLVTLIAALVALLVFSAGARDWAATRLLTDPIIKTKLEGTPPRNEAQPMRIENVAMRDGTRLSTQIYLPKGQGPWPVILVRDPYSFSQYVFCKVWVRYGYACVNQEVRGRGKSEGTWYPFVDERRDGIDTLNWILRQPWQNGKLGLSGGSYLGVVQWAVAGDLPPEVKTFVPIVSHGDIYDIVYHGGMFEEGLAGVWLSGQFRSPLELLTAGKKWRQEVAGHFPADGVERSSFGKAWRPYSDYIAHPDRDDPYWQSPDYAALRESYRKVTVPVFMIGFANDFFQSGMLRTYDGLPTRDQSLMVVGPGNHGGEAEPEVRGSYSREYADMLAWFDHYLKGAPLPDRLSPGINVFVHGANAWRHYARWPLPSPTVPPLTWNLSGLADAQSCDGGRLITEASRGESPVSFKYDPRTPVPTRGGPWELIGDTVMEQGADLCNRADVLSFSTPPLAADALLSGSVRAELMVSSDAADTAFTVKVSEHFADGRVYNIRDGISSLSLRNNAIRSIVYKPGERVELLLELTPILWQLHKGSRLRLDISSSNSPAFFPHPNRSELWSSVANPPVAHQTLYGGKLSIPIE